MFYKNRTTGTEDICASPSFLNTIYVILTICPDFNLSGFQDEEKDPDQENIPISNSIQVTNPDPDENTPRVFGFRRPIFFFPGGGGGDLT